MTAGRPPSALPKNAAKSDAHAWEVLRLFEAKAGSWAEKYALGGALVGRLASLPTAARKYAQGPDRVLDLGCGTGELARALAVAGLQVAGCDISPQKLLRAVRDCGRRAGWVQLGPDWQRQPFASVAFDVVVAASLLEHVREPAVVLGECARVLRPGGVMLYTVPDLRHPLPWAEWCAQHLARREPSGNSVQPARHPYRAYLSASRRRHRLQWWLGVAASVSLHPVRCLGSAGHPTSRLLVFRRTDQTGRPVMAAAVIVGAAEPQMGGDPSP